MNDMAGIEEKLKTLWDGDVPDENTEQSLRERVTKDASAAAPEYISIRRASRMETRRFVFF